MIQLKRILLPTDFSEFSGAATKYACELAAKFDAEIHLLHVLQTHAISTPEMAMALALPTYMQESKAAAEKALAKILDPKWAAGRKVVTAVVEGPPFLEIIRYAKANDIDLIVLGTHGRTGVIHALLGSVAENMVRQSPCPVLTVRPKGHQFVMP